MPNLEYWENTKRDFSKKILGKALSTIPPEVRRQAVFSKIPPTHALPWEVESIVQELLPQPASLRKIFAGGQVCPHFVHPIVEDIITRGELLTAYTPYQPEISQGSLQALFEFQSLLAELLQLDVVNAGLYDGSTALGEAVGLSMRVTKRKLVLVPEEMYGKRLSVLKTYMYAFGGNIAYYKQDSEYAVSEVRRMLLEGNQVAAVVSEYPLSTGRITDNVSELIEAAREAGALSIVYVDPLLTAIAKPPGALGADVAVAEGQSLGLPMNSGGPLLGILAVRGEHKLIRNMPGRLIGATLDREGRRSYALILQTREQHIRRERATSNITTNTALNAIAAAISVSLMGKHGIRYVASRIIENTLVLHERLGRIYGIRLLARRPVFKQVAFTLAKEKGSRDIVEVLRRIYVEKGIVPFEIDGGRLLSCTTEVHTLSDIDVLAGALQEHLS